MNAVAFECYLFCIKKYILNLLTTNVNQPELEFLYKAIQQIQNLAKNGIDQNKYYLGKSSGLVELVEHLFLAKSEKNKYGSEIEELKMDNRMKILDHCSQSLLD